jgi:hypothetical protein
MTQPAPGWYFDPAGRGMRWWDGQRWTDQVRDITIRTTIEKEEFSADPGRIALGETVLATDSIDTVTLGNYPRKGFVRRYWCDLSAGSVKLRISFWGGDLPGEVPAPLWVALTEFLKAYVLLRIGSELANCVAAGESVRLGRLYANRQGITGLIGLRRATLPWSSIHTVDRAPENVFVSGLDLFGRGRTLRTPTAKPNVVALRFLVELMQRGTSRTPPSG